MGNEAGAGSILWRVDSGGSAVKRAEAFLSWSTIDARIGPLAEIFKNWLDSLFSGEIHFFFSREIEPGEASIPTVYKALNGADFGFVFLSQRTARSPWVIYESGCLNPSLRAGRVFPLLFDLSPRELKSICPPLADFQAASLRNSSDVKRLVEKVARLIGLDNTRSIAIQARFHSEYSHLERAIQETVDSHRLLPERFAGTISYNDTIAGSRNFQMPDIFFNYQKDLYLVGINLHFLLNLKNSTESFAALLNSLMQDSTRRIRILISDLWDERIRYTYDKIVFGNGVFEFADLDSVLRDETSKFYLDKYIRVHTGEKYEQICRQLTIKKIGLLADTFWFIDADNPSANGDMLFSLMTTATGRARPVYYVNQTENPSLFSKYFDVCRAAYDLSSDILWPVMSAG